MTDRQITSLERKYRITAHFYDILDWPWERQYRAWRPAVVGDLKGRVIEVGVGTGRNLAHYPANIDLEAVDLSQAMLSRARRRVPPGHRRVTLRKADALDLDHLEDGSFDWYVATFLYCVLPDRLQPMALAEMRRLLAPSGRFRLVEIVYSRRFHRRLIQRVLAPFAGWIYGARFDRRTRDHLEAMPGLEITDVRSLKADTHLLLEGRRTSVDPTTHTESVR